MTISLALADAAKSAGVSDSTLKAAIHEGSLRAKRTGKNGGGKYLIKVTDLEAWVDGLTDA